MFARRGAGKNAAKTGSPRARRAVPERAVPPHPGRRCSRRRPQRLPEGHERGSQPRRAGWPRKPQRRRLLDGPAARAAEPPAGGILDACAGRDAQIKGAALAARCARRMPARLCDCRRCRVGWGDARQRRAHPPAGGFRGHGGGAPHESARRWRRRGAGCAVRKRSAAAADRAPPSPALGYAFPAGGEAREGDGGSERSERRGKGERAAIAARE